MQNTFFYALVGSLLLLIQGNSHAAEILSAQSGNWGSTTTWMGGIIPTIMDQVVIRTGDTVILESSGKQCASLTVEAGAKFFTNKSSPPTSLRYLYVYGNILCDGRIGNGEIYDVLCFNMEGRNCSITGSGDFTACRIRKYDNTNDTTDLLIGMDIRLVIGETAIYNNRSGTVFQIVIPSGVVVQIPGDGINPGNIAMDGPNGAASSTGGGSYTVQGTLQVSGILYLTNSNSANPVSFTIGNGGSVFAAAVSCPNSGASGHSLTIEEGGSLTFTSGDWGTIGYTNNNYSLAAGSLIAYTGTSEQIIGQPTAYGHLSASGSGTKKILENTVVQGNLTISSGTVIEADPGTTLTVSGSCILSGSECLVLKSPLSASPPASFICEGPILGEGTLRIERWVSGYQSPDDYRYHFLSSPVTAQSIQPLFAGDPPNAGDDFYRWDEPSATWINCKSGTGEWNPQFQPGDDRTFIPGQGYLVAYPSDKTCWFSGIPNQGSHQATLFFTPGTYEGYNLIGNPWCSALLGSIHTWEKNHVDNAIWVWDGEMGNYLSWNGTVGTLEGGIIPAMQGFFVHTNDLSPMLTIPSTARVHATQPFVKEAITNVLTFTITNGVFSDGMVLHLHQEATPEFDERYDVRKLMGIPEAPQLFWTTLSEKLSIDERPFPESEECLTLGIRMATDETLTLNITGFASFTQVPGFLLVDEATGETFRPTDDFSYTFLAPKGEDLHRFSLCIGSTPGYRDPSSSSQITPEWHPGYLHLKGLSPGAEPYRVTIFDETGRSVAIASASSDHPDIPLNLPSGFYLVSVSSANFSHCWKTIVY